MRNLLILSFIFSCLFTSLSIVHAGNPQHRVCRNTDGLFWSFRVLADDQDRSINTRDFQDDIGFCKYNNAYLDAVSLIKLIHEDSKTDAVFAFKKTRRSVVNNCQEAGALAIDAVDSNKLVVEICQFSDHSYIEEQTLVNGWNSIENKGLVETLLQN